MSHHVVVVGCVLAIIFSGASVNAAVSNFDDALYMHFQFDETKSALNEGNPWTYTEELTNSLIAELGPSVTTGVAGKIGNAFDFPGTSGSYVIAERPNKGATRVTIGSQFSVSAWVNSDVATYPHYARIATNKYSNSFYLGTLANSTQYQFIVNGNFGLTSGAVTPGSWQHVVGTYDETNAILYVDNSASSPVAMTAPAEIAQALTVGANVGDRERWQGKIDDVRIYNRALTSGEVDDLFNFTGPNATRENLVRNHSFEDNGSSPNNHYGTNSDSPRVWQKTVVNSMGNFNPVTSYGGELGGGDGTPNLAWISGNEATPRALFQDLLLFDDTPIMYEAGNYELKVLLAARADNPLVSGDSFTIALQTDADDPLSGTPLASLLVTDTQVNTASLIDFSTMLTLPAGDPAIGDRIRLVLRANDGVWTAEDVRLTFAPAQMQIIPEPSTLAIWALGLLGLCWYGLRRRK